MKPALLPVLVFLVAGIVGSPQLLAAPDEAPAVPLQVPQERLRIQQLRLQHEATAQRAQTDCYQKFAVSDCLRQVRAQKRLALDDLRRQEVILNDLERQTKAINTLNKIQQKGLEKASRSTAQP
ncbi:MAG: hypothetical protein A2503_15675 [Burkholderiales bacterium RIFOXYD12_FULL_59_19]|nr:MAG: hypothetical protein A2503_15675 [Burkholderiales bacterium RIFOXYD12_FULL_59_19]